MFSSTSYLLFSVIFYILTIQSCTAEPSLYLYSPGELEFTDVVVKRVGDNLTLECELRGDLRPPYGPAVYVWNYLPQDANLTDRLFQVETNGSYGSRLFKSQLTRADSGRYVCSAPPFSQAKRVLVQLQEGLSCAHGAFACGNHCVLPAYVCDGRSDCTRGEDEAPSLCGALPCARADRLNCSSGRCIPESACCRTHHVLCRQPACCEEHQYGPRGPYDEPPPLYDDRRAPDDYGFIQSTIYTVTACALIFMIAVVLLVSAICKMHMKRAALRSYATRDRQRARYMHLAQTHRFPPCYEASDLLEHGGHDPLPSPTHLDTQCGASVGSGSPSASERRTRLAALTSVFTSRYRQVPTTCTEVEMTASRSTAASSPSRGAEYRSPAGGRGCEGAPELNREPDLPSRLTLQLGRFQLSIPRFNRTDPRPDTPVASLSLHDLDLMRLNAHDTYTLNGRTIRLLGGNFENYPPLSHTHPPPYNEAMRYKLYGPPPEYLSRDRLNRTNAVDEEARSNVEMPPCYDELATNVSNGNNDNGNSHNENSHNGNNNDRGQDTACANPIVMDRSLIIMSNILERVMDSEIRNSNLDGASCSSNNASCSSAKNNDNDSIVISEITINTANNNVGMNLSSFKEGNNNNDISSSENANVETLDSVIDNLPAIDSDVNANDSVVVASC